MTTSDKGSLPFEEWSDTQLLTVAVVQRGSSFLSMMGSTYIIWKIVDPQQTEQTLNKMYQRIMFSLSVSDVVGSLGLFLKDWAMPADSLHSEFLYGNVGNRVTCDAQGFFVQCGYYAAILYNVVLAYYFLMTVKYGWREATWRKLEPFLHSFAILFPFATAIVCSVTGHFNHSLMSCWIQSYPLDCETSDDIDCIRGENAALYRLIFMVFPCIVCVISISTCMTKLCLFVRRVESDAMKYSLHSSRNGVGCLKKTKKVFRRSCWYVGALVVVWAPMLVSFL